MFKLLKIKGDSMYPSLKEGDTIFCMKPLFKTFVKGDIVVFRNEKEGLMIKELTKIDTNGYYVKGTSPYSIDSATFGYLQKEELLYKMLFKI